MRTYLAILTLCFSLSMAAQEVQLSWIKDFNVATETAKAENKPILVYFTKSDCSACLQFYTDFFQRETVKDLSNDYVLLMLDGSNKDMKSTDMAVIKQRRLVMHYNKSLTFPAILVINSDRQKLGELFTATDEASIANYITTLQSLK